MPNSPGGHASFLRMAEDGCLWICDADESATLGFTERGIESLKELIADQER